ncbi:MAG TPA: hypothetical protein VFJ30_17940 [Phycisphaerae bacterium]|nr:hypothetical protein [Phycisphaerae bacterium]
MIVWKGLGFLVLPIFVLGVLLVVFAVAWILGEEYPVSHAWPLVAGLCNAAIINFAVGWVLNKPHRGSRAGHTLYFIPMQYYSVIMFALALTLVVLRLWVAAKEGW